MEPGEEEPGNPRREQDIKDVGTGGRWKLE